MATCSSGIPVLLETANDDSWSICNRLAGRQSVFKVHVALVKCAVVKRAGKIGVTDAYQRHRKCRASDVLYVECVVADSVPGRSRRESRSATTVSLRRSYDNYSCRSRDSGVRKFQLCMTTGHAQTLWESKSGLGSPPLSLYSPIIFFLPFLSLVSFSVLANNVVKATTQLLVYSRR